MGYFLSLSKSSTETGLTVSEIVLIVSGAILTIGAVGEYLEEHNNLPGWMKWRKLVFILMVVTGLIGEFVSDAGVFVLSLHLQTLSDREFAGVNKNSSEARERAANAELRAAELLREIQPRDLDTKHEIGIAKVLRGLSGSDMPSLLAWYSLDPESARLAQELLSSLRGAGISPNVAPYGIEAWNTSVGMRSTDVVTGIRLYAGPKALPFAIALKDAIVRDSGPEVSVIPLDHMAGAPPRSFTGLLVFVGVKPIPNPNAPK
jgi:hypothetical protein